jgi:HlyD family secretion protein
VTIPGDRISGSIPAACAILRVVDSIAREFTRGLDIRPRELAGTKDNHDVDNVRDREPGLLIPGKVNGLLQAALRSLAAVHRDHDALIHSRRPPTSGRERHVSYRTTIFGLRPDTQMRQLLDRQLRPVALPAAGIVLNSRLARQLNVRAGDSVAIEFLQGERVKTTVHVAAIIEEMMERQAYMNRDALNRLVGEGDAISSLRIRLDYAQREAAQGGCSEQLEIRAPMAGRVLRVAQESEAVVGLGAPLPEIGDPTDLEVVIDVLSSDALQITPGQPVKLERQNSTLAALDGRVRKVEPAAFTKVSALDVEEQRVNVIIDITSPRAQWQTLGDAYRVDARIVIHNRSDAVKVPVAALFRDVAQWAMFVADGNAARKRVIETSRRGAHEALADKGIAPGERVIVYPADAEQEGRRISAHGMK